MKYTILTKRRVYDSYYLLDENWSEKLWEEQEKKCEELGIDTSSLADEVKCHFFDSVFFDEHTGFYNVYDAIQCLAIKDGVNLVQYENGNYGFVAYYSGEENGFEIMEEKTND